MQTFRWGGTSWRKTKRLTLEDRIDIQTGISQQGDFPFHRWEDWKDPSTISKEIKRTASCIQHPSNLIARIAHFSKAPMSVTTVQKRGRIVGLTAIFTTPKGAGTVRDYVEGVQTGHSLNKESFYQMDKVLTQGIQKKQHLPYHSAT